MVCLEISLGTWGPDPVLYQLFAIQNRRSFPIRKKKTSRNGSGSHVPSETSRHRPPTALELDSEHSRLRAVIFGDSFFLNLEFVFLVSMKINVAIIIDQELLCNVPGIQTTVNTILRSTQQGLCFVQRLCYCLSIGDDPSPALRKLLCE